MHSFRTRLTIIILVVLGIIFSGAYIYVRVTFAQVSNEYARNITVLTKNNARVIDAAYREFYLGENISSGLVGRENQARFSMIINETIKSWDQLGLLQVIDVNGKIIFDNNYVEVTGTTNAPPDVIKIIKLEGDEDHFIDTEHCSSLTELPEKTDGAISRAIVAQFTTHPCGELAEHSIEFVYPDVGSKHLAIRYIFSYDPIHSWIFGTIVIVTLLVCITIVIYIALYRKVSRPLLELKKAALEMAHGNLKYKISLKEKNEFGTVGNFMNEVARNLEEVITDLEDKERMVSELDVAGKIQRNMMPQETPDLAGLEIVGRTRSSTEVGGDIFNYVEVDENQTLVYIGDVTGHGVPACLVMIMVDILLHSFAGIYHSVKDILINVNKNLAPRIDTTFFVTMLLFSWEVQQQRLKYASAGHEHIVHYHAKTKVCDAVRSGGIALGMVLDISQMVQEKIIQLEDNDAIIIYSDGVTEAANPDGELFGLDRLQETVNKFGYRSAQGIFDGVTKTLSAFISEAPQNDDITLVVLKHRAVTQEDIERRFKKARLSIKEKALKREQKAVWDWEKPPK